MKKFFLFIFLLNFIYVSAAFANDTISFLGNYSVSVENKNFNKNFLYNYFDFILNSHGFTNITNDSFFSFINHKDKFEISNSNFKLICQKNSISDTLININFNLYSKNSNNTNAEIIKETAIPIKENQDTFSGSVKIKKPAVVINPVKPVKPKIESPFKKNIKLVFSKKLAINNFGGKIQEIFYLNNNAFELTASNNSGIFQKSNKINILIMQKVFLGYDLYYKKENLEIDDNIFKDSFIVNKNNYLILVKPSNLHNIKIKIFKIEKNFYNILKEDNNLLWQMHYNSG